MSGTYFLNTLAHYAPPQSRLRRASFPGGEASFLPYLPVRRNDLRSHRDILSAVGGGGFYGPLQAAAAGNLHAQHRYGLDVVLPENGRQLLAVVHAVQLGAGDEQDLSPEKIPVEVPIGIGSAVRGNQQVSAILCSSS